MLIIRNYHIFFIFAYAKTDRQIINIHAKKITKTKKKTVDFSTSSFSTRTK